MMKVLSFRFYKSLRPFNTFTAKRCSQTVFFREWSNQVFDSLSFPKKRSYDDHVFVQSVLNLTQIPQMEQKKSENGFGVKDNCI